MPQGAHMQSDSLWRLSQLSRALANSSKASKNSQKNPITPSTTHQQSSQEASNTREHAAKFGKLVYVSSLLASQERARTSAKQTTVPVQSHGRREVNHIENYQEALLSRTSRASSTSSTSSSMTLTEESEKPVLLAEHQTHVRPQAVQPQLRQKQQLQVLRKPKATNKTSFLDRYTSFETRLITSLESLTSLIDNYVLLSTLFRFNATSFGTSKKHRLLTALLRHISRAWILITLLRMKNQVLKYLKVNQAVKILEYQVMALKATAGTISEAAYRVLEIKLNVLLKEKTKLMLEFALNLNELVVFVIDSYGLKVTGFIRNLITLSNWGLSIYRVCQEDESESEKESQSESEKVIKSNGGIETGNKNGNGNENGKSGNCGNTGTTAVDEILLEYS